MFKQVFIFLTVLSTAFLVSCNTLHQPTLTRCSDDTMVIFVNQICNNEKLNFSLRFDSVLNDSRCPLNADCIWAGNAQIRLKLMWNADNSTLFTLNTFPDFVRDTVFQGIRFTLIEVYPYPVINTERKYADYRAKIVAVKE